MYQLDDKPQERNLEYLAGYHFEMHILLKYEQLYGVIETREFAESEMKKSERNRKLAGTSYFRVLGIMWACHDYLEGETV